MIDKADQSKSRLFSLEGGTLKISEIADLGEVNLPQQADLGHKPGSVIDSKYTIVKLLGEGGMGVVYIAHHAMLDKDVALKTFRSKELGSEALIRFQREAQAIARLNHQHIVQVFDFGQSEDGMPYYTMELLSGKTLADKLQREGPLPAAVALPIFEQVCQGLAAAHAKGIVHRDLKPANICLEPVSLKTGREAVKIVDFGIASLNSTADAQRLTGAGIVFGSPLYMSPEQALGQPVTPQSDIYSLGCTLYETLTGKTPFRGETAVETIMQHQLSLAPSLREASGGKNFGHDLENLVDAMLAKKPAERPESIGKIESILAEITASKKSTAVAASPKKTASQPILQQKMPPASPPKTIIIASALTLIALSGAGIYWQSQKQHSAPDIAGVATSKSMSHEHKSPRAAAFIAKRNRLEKVDGKEYFVLEFEPKADLGTIQNGPSGEQPIPAIGKTKWETRAPVSFVPSADFWSDMDNFEAIPDNSLMRLNCEYAPQNVDKEKLFACVARQSQTLVGMHLAGIDLKGPGFATLSQLKHLNALGFVDSDVDGSEISKLPHLNQYYSFDFTEGKNARAVLQTMKGSLTLEQLWLNGDRLTSADIALIMTMKSLRRLDLTNNRALGDADLKSLLALKRLGELRVPSCNITPAALPTLQMMKKAGLTDLFLTCTNWPKSDVEKLIEMFPNGDFKFGFVNQKQKDAIPDFSDLYQQESAVNAKK